MSSDVFNRKLHSFKSTDNATRILFIQAFVLSAFVKLALRFYPFSKILGWKGSIGEESPSGIDDPTNAYRRRLQTALTLCKKYTPWTSECYTRALTGKILLRRRGIPATVYIGFKKDGNGKYLGHAWLRSFDVIITGAEEMKAFTVHSYYS